MKYINYGSITCMWWLLALINDPMNSELHMWYDTCAAVVKEVIEYHACYGGNVMDIT